MRSFTLHTLLMVLAATACGTDPAMKEGQEASPAAVGTSNAVADGPQAADTVAARVPAQEGAQQVGMDTMRAAPTPRRLPADEACLGHAESGPDGVRVTEYIPRSQLKARERAITEGLPAYWMMAEQGAPVSIADNFEQGISTEHRHMPDTLEVAVHIYARCRDRSPYAVQHYRVWRAADGSIASYRR